MTRAQSIDIRQRLNTLLPPDELEHLATSSGLIRRRRKLDPSVMFWTLVLGFGAGRVRSLAGLRRVYERVGGHSIAASSFHSHFSPALVRFLRAILTELIERVAAERPDVRGLLAPFADVVLADATVIKLHRLLAGKCPDTRTNSSPAAAKLYLVYSVFGGGVRHARLTGERTCEHGRCGSVRGFGSGC